MFDLEQLRWSEEMAGLFGIPTGLLPEVVPSSGALGECTVQGALARAPLASLVADSHAALFGLGCVEPGTAKATYGTGTSLASPTGATAERSTNGLATSVAWLCGKPTYALEGNVFSTGATVEWVARLLGLVDAAAVEKLAQSVPGSGGVHIVPGFSGLGAPYWRPEARGQVSGLTFGTGGAELALAAIESIAFQVTDLVAAVERDTGTPLRELRADGGAAHNSLLMQLQADLLGCPVVTSGAQDAAARGAAFLAGLATDVFTDTDVAVMARGGNAFEPRMDTQERVRRLGAWGAAVNQATAIT
jgi:glycerol kinase